MNAVSSSDIVRIVSENSVERVLHPFAGFQVLRPDRYVALPAWDSIRRSSSLVALIIDDKRELPLLQVWTKNCFYSINEYHTSSSDTYKKEINSNLLNKFLFFITENFDFSSMRLYLNEI